MTDVAELGSAGMRNVGARVFRSEDPRILTGRGRYIDDLVLTGMLRPVPRADSVGVTDAVAVKIKGPGRVHGPSRPVLTLDADGGVLTLLDEGAALTLLDDGGTLDLDVVDGST